MKKEDFRERIIPVKLNNKIQGEEIETEDLIYIDSAEEQMKWKENNEDRVISATDYAIMNHAISFEYYKNKLGKSATWAWLRSSETKNQVYSIALDGKCQATHINQNHGGICPALHYKLPENDEVKEELNIKEVKDEYGNILYHTLEIGEYPKSKVNSELEEELEKLYNDGNIKEGMTSTGKWYSENGVKQESKIYAGKHSPEFTKDGEKYVRIISNTCNEMGKYSDGTVLGKLGSVKWVKVEPISFIIKNWEELPKNINPEGSEKDTFFDLRAEEAIIGNIPFSSNNNSGSWENSMVRAFLNGIDVSNIYERNNTTVINNGNFLGKCNFINEAFNRRKRTNL